MGTFHLPHPCYAVSLKNGEVRRFGDERIVEIGDDDPLAEVLRSCGDVIELSVPPPKVCWRYVAENTQRTGAVGLPPLNKPVVLVGRGRSCEQFEKRYPASDYIRVGIQPGSIPSGQDDRSGVLMDAAPHFDAIVVFDGNYPHRCGDMFLSKYSGPILAADTLEQNFPNRKQVIPALKFCREKHPGLSLIFAMYVMEGLGAKTLILCGTDMELPYDPGTYAHVLAHIQRLRNESSMEIFIDGSCVRKDSGRIWVGRDGDRYAVPRPTARPQTPGIWLVAGMGATLDRRSYMLGDHRFNVLGCNTALRRIANPDVWLVTDDNTAAVYAGHAAKLDSGTAIWARKDAAKQLPVSRFIEYPTDENSLKWHGRSGSVVACRLLCADGAREIHLIGMSGYKPGEGVAGWADFGGDACRGLNEAGALGFHDCMKTYPNTSFVWYDDSVYLALMPKPLPENCHVVH